MSTHAPLHAPLHASLPPLAGPRTPSESTHGFGPAPLGFRRGKVARSRAGELALFLGVVLVLVGVAGAVGDNMATDRGAVIQVMAVGGVALLIVGGFWAQGGLIARLAEDNRRTSRQLADALIVMADVCSRVIASAEGAGDLAAMPVTVLGGTTVHRRDCSLLHERDQVVPVPSTAVSEASSCRACRPHLPHD